MFLNNIFVCVGNKSIDYSMVKNLLKMLKRGSEVLGSNLKTVQFLQNFETTKG